MIKKKILTVVAVVAAAFSANAATVFEDTFESYTDSAAFIAAYPLTASPAGVAPEPALTVNAGDGAQGSNKFVTMPVSPSTVRRGKALASSFNVGDVIDVTMSYYLRAATHGSGTHRAGVSLRDAAGGAGVLIKIGANNAFTANNPGPAPGDPLQNKWVSRFVGVPGISSAAPHGGHYTLLTGPVKSDSNGTWVKLGVKLSSTAAKFYVNDVEYTIDGVVPSGAPTAAIGSVMIGDGVTTTNAYDVDSIKVETTTANVNDWNMY